MQREHHLYTYSYLYKITSSSPAFIHKMIGLFVSSLDEYMGELKGLLQTQNLAELKKVLHKMKPSVMNLEVKGAGEVLSSVSESNSWTAATTESVSGLLETLTQIKPLMEKDLEEIAKEAGGEINN